MALMIFSPSIRTMDVPSIYPGNKKKALIMPNSDRNTWLLPAQSNRTIETITQ